MTEQTCESGAQAAPPPSESAAQANVDPLNAAALIGSLCDRLRPMQIRTTCKKLPGGPAAGALITCAGGGLTQLIALRPDPDRQGLFRWYWLWSDELRGQGPLTPEPICPGEDIMTAILSVGRVLGVRPVAH